MKAVLFDVYGTLISTGNGSVSAVERILGKHDIGIDPKGFYREWKEFHKQRMKEIPYITEREIFSRGLGEMYSKYRIKGDHTKDVQIMIESLYDRIAITVRIIP